MFPGTQSPGGPFREVQPAIGYRIVTIRPKTHRESRCSAHFCPSRSFYRRIRSLTAHKQTYIHCIFS